MAGNDRGPTALLCDAAAAADLAGLVTELHDRQCGGTAPHTPADMSAALLACVQDTAAHHDRGQRLLCCKVLLVAGEIHPRRF